MGDNLSNSAYSAIESIYKKFNSKGVEAVRFYCILFIIILSISALIPPFLIKPPCDTSTNYQNKKHCTLLGETDKDTLLDWKQNSYLTLYSLNIVSSVICIILSIVLLIF